MAKTAVAKKRAPTGPIPYPEIYCPDRAALAPVIEALTVLIPYPESECEYTNSTVTVTKKKLTQRPPRSRRGK